MKFLVKLIIIFQLMQVTTNAQLINPGNAIVTDEGAGSMGIEPRTIFVVDVNSGMPAFPAANDMPVPYYANMINPPGGVSSQWLQPYTGPLFGVAIKNKGVNHEAFLGYSGFYNTSPATINTGTAMILSLSFNTGAVSKIIKSVNDPIDYSISTNKLKLYNTGSGIGNITYDSDHNQLFFTNFEDGRIYRMSALNYQILDCYDPWVLDNSVDGLAPLGERIWGIGYYNNKLYFSRWNEELVNASSALKNEIVSIEIDPNTGEFSFPIGTSSISPELVVTSTSNPFLELTIGNTIFHIPALVELHVSPSKVAIFTPPISDIEFSTDGKMLISEKSMKSPKVDYNQSITGWAHYARSFMFEKNGSQWERKSHFKIAPNHDGESFGGGVDFGYGKNCTGTNQIVNSDFNPVIPNDSAYIVTQNCENIIWGTGDCIGQDPYCKYGIAGLKTSSNIYTPNQSKGYIFKGINETNKCQVGDVDIYRFPCGEVDCSSSSGCDFYNLNSLLDVQQNGNEITITDISPININVNFTAVSVSNTSLVDYINPGGSVTYTFQKAGSYEICLITGVVDSSSVVGCYDTACTQIVIDSCMILQSASQMFYTLEDSIIELVIDISGIDVTPDSIIWSINDSVIVVNNNFSNIVSCQIDESEYFNVSYQIYWSIIDSTNVIFCNSYDSTIIYPNVSPPCLCSDIAIPHSIGFDVTQAGIITVQNLIEEFGVEENCWDSVQGVISINNQFFTTVDLFDLSPLEVPVIQGQINTICFDITFGNPLLPDSCNFSSCYDVYAPTFTKIPEISIQDLNNGLFNVSFNESLEIEQCLITTISGSIVYSENNITNLNKLQLDLRTLSKGMYIGALIDSENRTIPFKFIIR